MALDSLNKCHFEQNFLVIVVVNESLEDPEDIRKQNLKTIAEIEKLSPQLNYPVLVSHEKFKPKKAGVGLARKVGMDEAAWMFEQIEKDGIIVCYDADCTCEPNYLQAIQDFYSKTNNECGIVFYEHRQDEHDKAIVKYELFLRYYVDALRWTGFPYAFQTLGSCITVKSRRYQKEGGMNTRKAGEDFYFLHKVIPNGKFGEINSTTIHPSDRVSDRVPFGTGHAINKYLNDPDDHYLTYSPQIFQDLKSFISEVSFSMKKSGYPVSIASFFDENTFQVALQKIKKESTDETSFRKKFFDWFDGFRILKFVHFARDHFYPNIDLIDAVSWLDNEYYGIGLSQDQNQNLKALREHNRNQKFE